MIQWMLLQWMLQRITNLVHQEVTSDVDLIMVQTASKVNAAVLMDGVDLQKLTVIVMNATDLQKSLNLKILGKNMETPVTFLLCNMKHGTTHGSSVLNGTPILLI